MACQTSKFFGLTLAFAVGLLTLSGQSGFRFSVESVETGLSQNSVNAIIHDENGLYWVGTQDGLNRFNGEEYRVYRSSGTHSGLTDNFITCLAEARDGSIWIGTRNGLNRLAAGAHEAVAIANPYFSDPLFETIDQVAAAGHTVAVLGDSLRFIDQSRTTLNGCYVWNRGNPRAICAWDDSFFIVGSSSLFQWRDHAVRKIKDLPLNEAWSGIRISKEDTIIWSDHRVEIHGIHSSEWRLDESIINDVIWHADELWVATSAGLFTARNGRMSRIHAANEQVEPLMTDNVHGFMIDNSGALWMGTNHYGAFRWSPNSRLILHLPPTELADPIVWSAAFFNDHLFVGTTNGIDIFKASEGWQRPGLSPGDHLEHRKRIEGWHLSSMLVTDSALYMLTRQNGLYLLDAKNDKLEFQKLLNRNGGESCYHLASDGKDNIFISCSESILQIKKGTFYSRLLLKKSFPDIHNNYSHHIKVLGDSLFCSGTQGVLIISKDGIGIDQWSEKSGELVFPVTGNVLPDGSGGIWISYLGGGATHVERGKNAEHYGLHEGLRNDVVYTISQRGNDFWFTTNEGLSLVRRDRIINFDKHQGIPLAEHSQNGTGKFGDQLWFGGVGGLYWFAQEWTGDLDIDGRTIITDILINNQKTDSTDQNRIKGNPYMPNEIVLAPESRNLTLEVTSPGYRQGNDREVCYRLTGVSDEWSGLGKMSGRIDFSSLPSGTHDLQIGYRLSENGEILGRHSVLLRVLPPFFETLWFRILTAIAFALFAFIVARYFVRRRLKDEVLKRQAIERVKEERERISMELHDNIGAQITHVITSLDNISFKLASGRSDKPADEVDALSDFARGTMQQLRDTIWTLHRESIELNGFVERIHDYVARLLADRDQPIFTVDNRIQSNIPLEPIETINLFRVVQEAVNNSLKYAEASQIRLFLTFEDGKLFIHIQDDGNGFDLDHILSEQYGLRNMKTRMEQLGGSLMIDTKPGEGCTVSAVLPLSKRRLVD